MLSIHKRLHKFIKFQKSIRAICTTDFVKGFYLIRLNEVVPYKKWYGFVNMCPDFDGRRMVGEDSDTNGSIPLRSEEHTSELQSRQYLVCRLLLEKKKNKAC